MKNITFTHNGFHGSHTFTVRPLSLQAINHDVFGERKLAPDYIATVSRAVANRINKAVCGITGCTCGEGFGHDSDEETVLVYIPSKRVVHGNYPQN